MRRRTVILLAIVAATAAAGTVAGRWGREVPTQPKAEVIDGLRIDSSELDFGEVWCDRDVFLPLSLTNTTDRAIHIEAFQTGCHCQLVEPKSLTVPPGVTSHVRLMLNMDPQLSVAVGQPRQIDTQVRPILHGKPASKAWRVRGTIRPLISTDTTAVLFGESNRVGQSPVARRVRVQFRDPGVVSVELKPAVADVKVVAGNSPTEWFVIVSPFTDRKPGPFGGTLTIVNLSPDGTTPMASLDLPVEGVLLEAAQ